jgi:uncharacterized lipoprotein NlpE involved in copper resistance
MKFCTLFFIVILLAGCEENRQHDGVYISEQPIFGVMKTWIVEGNAITYYLMGEVKVASCKQYDDRVETSDGVVYPIDKTGNLMILNKDGLPGEKLLKRTTKTKFTPAELEKMIDEAMPPPALMKDYNATH